MKIVEFAGFSARQVLIGGRSYYGWLAFLLLLIFVGIVG